ncbi:SDR family NAD(P)-dependent oxidoreductase [Actinomadura sp. WMMB 499]|uniref:SDR family NAD(P)-dependent oxidoreductase n=1 Tax=Actinomadura sp. WMMB 499 TaxID=1219491 RepID=UPI00124746B9|nr:SDR family NAD(P)-dependent oxidoreductase [Actinomadura sp. WMMB 499]QFG22886.1 SDR family NAD(P)-dependent oxidoreductase [Actinomadura sp. WMMB 499]
MNFEGRSAIIAGGAGGLGSATARRLAELGFGVVIVDIDTDRAQALVSDLGAKAAFVPGDTIDDDVVDRAVAAAGELGSLFAAVSATGVVIRAGRTVEADGTLLSKDVMRANFDLHVLGPFNLARIAAAAMARNEADNDGQCGVIVQTASISAYDAQVTMVPYAAAKGGVASMVLPMARDLAPLGIRVNAIAPGAFGTPRLSDPKIRALLARDNVFPKRVGHPDEYATVVEAIVRTPYLNAQVIRVDGGARLRGDMTQD